MYKNFKARFILSMTHVCIIGCGDFKHSNHAEPNKAHSPTTQSPSAPTTLGADVPGNRYSNSIGAGYMMGVLDAIHTKKGILSSKLELNLLLGQGSSPLTLRHSFSSPFNRLPVTLNPFILSANIQDESRLQAFLQKSVWISYETNLANLLGSPTNRVLQDIQLTGKQPSKVWMCNSSDDKANYTPHSQPGSLGQQTGRIVYAAKDNETTDIIMQIGENGNTFLDHMVAVNNKIYDCAVEYLKLGYPVRASYEKNYLIHDTVVNYEYTIWKIEPVGTALP